MTNPPPPYDPNASGSYDPNQYPSSPPPPPGSPYQDTGGSVYGTPASGAPYQTPGTPYQTSGGPAYGAEYGYQQQPAAYAPYGYDPVSGLPYSEKSKVVAGVLQILLGAFGAGRFYTGHTTIAIWQIVATWLTCGIGGIWPLIDGIMILVGNQTDAQGRILRP